MKIRTNMKAGRLASNHNQALVRKVRAIRVKTAVLAGRLASNHNESLLR